MHDNASKVHKLILTKKNGFQEELESNFEKCNVQIQKVRKKLLSSV
jgi:hypothetical protein